MKRGRSPAVPRLCLLALGAAVTISAAAAEDTEIERASRGNPADAITAACSHLEVRANRRQP